MKQSKLSFGAPSPAKKVASKAKESEKKLVDPLQFFSKKISQKPPVVLKKSSFFNDTEIDHVLMAQGDVLEAALEPMDVSDENNPLVDNVSMKMNGPREDAKEDSLKELKEEPKERKELKEEPKERKEMKEEPKERKEMKEEPKEGNEEPKKKFNYYAHKQKLAQMPKAHGSKEIPVGEDNCLGGLAFVFTGELTSLTREEAIDLVKRYGA
jgi:replication factor C subunit 1